MERKMLLLMLVLLVYLSLTYVQTQGENQYGTSLYVES